MFFELKACLLRSVLLCLEQCLFVFFFILIFSVVSSVPICFTYLHRLQPIYTSTMYYRRFKTNMGLLDRFSADLYGKLFQDKKKKIMRVKF
jgi:hypothetical protein